MLTLDQLAALPAQTPVALTFVPDPDLNGSEPWVEAATLLRVWGSGDELRAEFQTREFTGGSYDWEAYMFDGRLSFGSSAEELQVSL